MALDGDRGELLTIKRELDELRHVSLLQEANQALANASNLSGYSASGNNMSATSYSAAAEVAPSATVTATHSTAVPRQQDMDRYSDVFTCHWHAPCISRSGQLVHCNCLCVVLK